MNSIMTLADLRGVTNAFDEFVIIEDSNLPDYYKSIFPHKCVCGAEVIMTAGDGTSNGNTQLQCCNPDCWVKMAYRFAYFARALGYKGFGAVSAKSLYAELHTQFEYPSFLCIFDMPAGDIRRINGDAYTESFLVMKDELKNKAWPFKDAIAALGIPDVGKNCTLFDIVKDPNVLLNYVLKNKLTELCRMAGIYATKTYYYLNVSRVDILLLFHNVMPHIMATPKNEIYIAITGPVSVDGIGLTRAEFLWKCESIKDDKNALLYKLVETKSESKLDYVIADVPSATAKYKLGQRLNKLITANDFYHMLVQNAGGVSDNVG